jgi:hypothetical protein
MEHPPRLNYSFAPRRIERLKATPEFRDIATSTKKGKERDEEIRYGKSVQRDIVVLLADMDGRRIYHDRDEFLQKLEALFKGMIRFPSYFWDVMMDALSERDEIADVGSDPEGSPEPDPERG